MNKTAQLVEYKSAAVKWAFTAMEKKAADPKVKLSIEDVEKVAEARAERAVAARVKTAELETLIEVTNNTIQFLNDNNFKQAANALSKQAMEELKEVEMPEAPAEEAAPEVAPEAEPVAEEEPSEDEITAAAIQGAAEVVAEIAGKQPEDPEVQEVAKEIVEEAVRAVQEAEISDEGAGGETETEPEPELEPEKLLV